MLLASFFFLPLLVATIHASHQTYPGTRTRPVLSDSEAAQYTVAKYLAGWSPEKIQTSRADYTVGSGHYSTIQQAVNAAVKAGGTKRKYIRIEPGVYKETVYIPKTTVPLTLYGVGSQPQNTHIISALGASMSVSAWTNIVNPNGQRYKNGDPAWNMFEGCAKRDHVGICATVFWSQADNLEVANLLIENTSTNGQGLAAKIDADKQHFDHVYFYGFQDTLYVGNHKTYFNSPAIKGDVDFIFGSGPAVFESALIIARADRPRAMGLIFAPSTDNNQKYGILLYRSKITAESAIAKKKGLSLARGWYTSTSANGELLIRESIIDDVINVNAPYSTDTGGRAYSGNANRNRNLDDSHYNRFWEYKNTGGGA